MRGGPLVLIVQFLKLVLSFAPWLALLLIVVSLLLRKRQPSFGFLLAWWVVTLVPALDIRQLSFPLPAERFSYLPSVGLCLSLAYVLLAWLPQRFPTPLAVRAGILGEKRNRIV